MHVLLLDMDGVLIEPKGYHNALQETVRVWGQALGYGEVHLPLETIHRFESVGLTSEWESASVCVALMLIERWKSNPEFRLPESIHTPIDDVRVFNPSAWEEFLVHLDGGGGGNPITEAEDLLATGLASDDHRKIVRSMIRNARYIDRSPIHRTQQEFVLGSEQMQPVYGLEPNLNVEGALLRDDKPMLSEEDRSLLIRWLKVPDRSAVVFTNRPCTPPEGHFDTPEAEMGLTAAGLDQLALIGCGTMGWLSVREDKPLFAFLKPSPVHALTAMLKAVGMSTQESLQVALMQSQGTSKVGALSRLQHARVDVFEDSTNGLESALAAEQLLNGAGIQIDLRLHGVSTHREKNAALKSVGARTSDQLREALYRLPGFTGS